MGKSKIVKSDAIVQLEEQLREAKRKEKNAGKVERANQIIEEFGSEYEHAKMVFFKVNGARRVLKHQ